MLLIEESEFLEVFGRDVDFYSYYPQSFFLDLETGDLLWHYDRDDDAHVEAGIPREENAASRERVAKDPKRHLEIPGLDHHDHHEILQEFLYSEWCADEQVRRRAQDAYFGSIGGWKEAVADEDVVHSFYCFRNHAIKRRAEQHAA